MASWIFIVPINFYSFQTCTFLNKAFLSNRQIQTDVKVLQCIFFFDRIIYSYISLLQYSVIIIFHCGFLWLSATFQRIRVFHDKSRILILIRWWSLQRNVLKLDIFCNYWPDSLETSVIKAVDIFFWFNASLRQVD